MLGTIFNYVLIVATVMVAVGLMAWLVYDIVATLSNGKIQTISSKVQNWGYTHKFWLLLIGGLTLGGMVSLLVHFLWP